MKLTRYLIPALLAATAVLAAMDKDTVAMLDNKEAVSAGYFRDIRDRIKKDPIEQYIRKLDFNRNFNSQVLRIIAENYILWEEAKKQGFHHQMKFKQRFISALQGFFAEYVSRKLGEKGVLRKEQQFDRAKIGDYLLKLYAVKIHVKDINDKAVFTEGRQSPELEYGKPFPDAKFTPYSRFQKKEAEKYTVITYRKPDEKTEIKVNLREVLDRLPDYDFFKFKAAPALDRHEILKSIISGDLIPLEFKRLSDKDPQAKEYVRRVEQVTLARFYRIVRGIDASSDYVLSETEKSLEPVSLTRAEMEDYFNKNKHEFDRPRTAKVWILRLTRAEVDEGDQFIEELKDFEEDFELGQKKIYELQDQRGLLMQKKRATSDAKAAEKIEKDITSVTASIDQLQKKLDQLAKEIPRKKFDRFQEKMNEINARPDRKNGKMKKSEPLGELAFSAEKDMKRYEAIAFTVPNQPFNGKESILFNSGEGDYVILFVQDSLKMTPDFNDMMVQTRVRYSLELKKRKEIIRDLINARMKQVLSKENVNWKVLEGL